MATSRLCVKGLPKHASDDHLRKLFREKGQVTDAKIVRTRDGASRQFGFVGFKSVEEAEAAQKYFNRSFMGTVRLAVEFASAAGSKSLARPWSKYSTGSSAHSQKHPRPAPDPEAQGKNKRHKQAAPEEEDPQLAEFLRLMQPRHKNALWADEPVQQPPHAAKLGAEQQADQGQKQGRKQKQSQQQDQPLSADTDPDELLQAKRGMKQRGASAHAEALQDGAEDGQSEPAAADPQQQADVHDNGVSDMDYLKSRMTATFSASSDEEDEGQEPQLDTDSLQGEGELPSSSPEPEAEHEGPADEGLDARRSSNSEASTTSHASGPSAQTRAEQTASSPETVFARFHAVEAEPGDLSTGDLQQDEAPVVAQTARLFVRNLPFAATAPELTQVFQEHGELSEVHIVQDRTTGKSKGLAFVQYASAEAATEALQVLDGSIFQGRLLHVLPAHSQPGAAHPEPQSQHQAPSGSFQEQKQAARKEGAGNRAAWNALFMRADTVSAAVAAHYGISKAQLLDRDAADLPVRMALGEAHVISLTKASLADAGVDVASLEAAAEAGGHAARALRTGVDRSPTVLLVKNLAYSVTKADLLELFSKFGEVARMVLPDTRTLALVEMGDAAAARKAFKGAAYKALHHVPLFLEWAPQGIFTPQAATLQDAQEPLAEPGQAAEHPLASDMPSTTLYVKNLAWATTDASLLRHFDAAVSAAGGTVRSAVVQKRKVESKASKEPNAKTQAKALSAGFGFVECSTEASAKAAMRKLQASFLDKHKLDIRLSMRGPSAAHAAPKAPAKKAEAAKLLVRNVAFEAAKKDIQALFAPMGQVKRCSLPRKFDGNHRGFAFVEFFTKQEAKAAAEAITGVHLYGRRLVVEFAKADEGLDDLRSKAASQIQR